MVDDDKKNKNHNPDNKEPKAAEGDYEANASEQNAVGDDAEDQGDDFSFDGEEKEEDKEVVGEPAAMEAEQDDGDESFYPEEEEHDDFLDYGDDDEDGADEDDADEDDADEDEFDEDDYSQDKIEDYGEHGGSDTQPPGYDPAIGTPQNQGSGIEAGAGVQQQIPAEIPEQAPGDQPPSYEGAENHPTTEQPEVSDSLSEVASNRGVNVVAIFLIVVVLGGAMYYLLYSGEDQHKNESEPKKATIAKNLPIVIPPSIGNDSISSSQIPDLPDVSSSMSSTNLTPPSAPPTLKIAGKKTEEETKKTLEKALAPPSLAAPTNTTSSILPFDSGKVDEKKNRRLKSSLAFRLGGKAGKGLVEAGGKQVSTLARSAGQITAQIIGDTHLIIAEGKIIDAVLETGINTDLPGPLRAIVSRNIYGESGRSVLIPEGSRLIGSYKNNISYGENRVMVIWKRLIRPDGISFLINSMGTDELGRAGVKGEVYTKYAQTLANSLLVSAINIALGKYTDKQTYNQANKQRNISSQSIDKAGNTNTVYQDTAYQAAVKQAVSNISDIGKQMVDQTIKQQPTIVVDQGTRVKVFVQHDLVFPENIINSSGVIR